MSDLTERLQSHIQIMDSHQKSRQAWVGKLLIESLEEIKRLENHISKQSLILKVSYPHLLYQPEGE